MHIFDKTMVQQTSALNSVLVQCVVSLECDLQNVSVLLFGKAQILLMLATGRRISRLWLVTEKGCETLLPPGCQFAA